MSTTKAPPRRGKRTIPQEGKQTTRGPAKRTANRREVGTRASAAQTSGARARGPRPSAKRAAPDGETITFESSTGNVFADMGAPDAEERLAKAELARIVRGVVRERQVAEGWTQARAARALGIAPADMSNLLRGKLAGFSQERLGQFLTRLGMDVRIQVAPRPAEQGRAAITVERVAVFA